MKTIIKNAYIYDGSGNHPYHSDIILNDDIIFDIAPDISCSDAELVDADGMIITPGFIDIHRHFDSCMFSDDLSGLWEPMLAQGVSTALVGNCGMSAAPRSPKFDSAMRNYTFPVLGRISDSVPLDFPAYIQKIRSITSPVNVFPMIGTGSIRIAVKGFSDSPYTDNEMQRAKAYLKEAINCGAQGISMGIMYLPECYSSVQEYIELLEYAGKTGTPVCVHMRGEGDSLVKSVDEVITICRHTGCPFEISHFKSCGPDNWNNQIFAAIELIDNARNEGLDIGCDFYPYDGGATTLMSMIPPAFIGGDPENALQKLSARNGIDELRASCSVLYEDWDNYCILLGWDRIIISSVSLPDNNKYLGKTVSQAAEEFGFNDEYELVAHLLSSEHGQVGIINKSMSQSDIDAVAALPYSIIISDSIYGGIRHPRVYGSFPKAIRDFSIDRKILPLEKTISKMTFLPAQKMRIADRGLIKAGYKADINIFDPLVFKDNADYLKPDILSSGMFLQFINGNPVHMSK